jgi:alkylhydroperoxidase/carboxymuconolactone decarboxylase family protein YurZ
MDNAMKQLAAAVGVFFALGVTPVFADTIENLVGNRLTTSEPDGAVVIMHLKADHTYDMELASPPGKGAWHLQGGKICEANAGGAQACNSPAGKWHVEGDAVCIVPDEGDTKNVRDCFPVERGKKVGDTWTQVNGEQKWTLSLTAEQPASVASASMQMQRITPALARYTNDVLLGDIWKRPNLSPRDRSLVTVAILIATNKTGQLEGQLRLALDNGVKPTEIAGLTTHLAFYSGWPNAVAALDAVDRVFRARGINAAALRPTSNTLLPALASDAALEKATEDRLGPIAPKFAELTSRVLLDDLWRRPDLAPRDRSLVTIVALAAEGDADSLPYHLERALTNGLTAAQISEALTHLAFYAGWPKASTAVWEVGKFFAKRAAGAGEQPQESPSGR